MHVEPAALQNISNYLMTEGSISRVPAVADIYDPSYAGGPALRRGNAACAAHHGTNRSEPR